MGLATLQRRVRGGSFMGMPGMSMRAVISQSPGSRSPSLATAGLCRQTVSSRAIAGQCTPVPASLPTPFLPIEESPLARDTRERPIKRFSGEPYDPRHNPPPEFGSLMDAVPGERFPRNYAESMSGRGPSAALQGSHFSVVGGWIRSKLLPTVCR